MTMGSGSDGSSGFGRGRRRILPERSSRGGGVAGVSESGAPGLILGRCSAVEHRRGMSSPQVGSDGWCGAGNGSLDGEGGSAATKLAGARCRGA